MVAAAQKPPQGRLAMHEDLEVLGSSANALTRHGGGRVSTQDRLVPRRLVVDVREFMSPLPAVLHAQVGCPQTSGSSGSQSPHLDWQLFWELGCCHCHTPLAIFSKLFELTGF